MKKFALLLMLSIMGGSFSSLNARTISGWCGNNMEVPDNTSYDQIMLQVEILNLLCDIQEYGLPDEENQPVNP